MRILLPSIMIALFLAAPVMATAQTTTTKPVVTTPGTTPVKPATTPAATPPAATTTAPAATPPATQAPKTALIDINSASLAELDALPGIGAVRSKAIGAGRPYKGKDDLVAKKIIPQGVYDKIKDQIIAKQK
jgi:DNA uptake protein ComE-like DNA-binding protein